MGEAVRNRFSEDTLWVQFVIRKVFDGPGMIHLNEPLALDGKYGNITKAWITHFQRNSRAQSLAQGIGPFGTAGPRLPVRPDGAVSKVPPGPFDTRKGFTAYKLNKALANTDTLLWLRLTSIAASSKDLQTFVKVNA